MSQRSNVLIGTISRRTSAGNFVSQVARFAGAGRIVFSENQVIPSVIYVRSGDVLEADGGTWQWVGVPGGVAIVIEAGGTLKNATITGDCTITNGGVALNSTLNGAPIL